MSVGFPLRSQYAQAHQVTVFMIVAWSLFVLSVYRRRLSPISEPSLSSTVQGYMVLSRFFVNSWIPTRYQLGLKYHKLVTPTSPSGSHSMYRGIRKPFLFFLIQCRLHLTLRILSLCASNLRIVIDFYICWDQMYASISSGFAQRCS
jgi:hypothetical protein